MRDIYRELTGRESLSELVDVSGEEFYGAGYEDCDRRMPILDKAHDLLGWQPRIPLAEALRRTMTHFHEFYSEMQPLPLGGAPD